MESISNNILGIGRPRTLTRNNAAIQIQSRLEPIGSLDKIM